MPRPFLRKILQALSHNGLLKSSKGINGGFSLALTPEKITVYDVMKAFQGDLQLTEHVFRGRPCPEIKTCCLKKKICDIEERLTRDLRSITITSLI
jgi:Rrf2 family protein